MFSNDIDRQNRLEVRGRRKTNAVIGQVCGTGRQATVIGVTSTPEGLRVAVGAYSPRPSCGSSSGVDGSTGSIIDGSSSMARLTLSDTGCTTRSPSG